MHSSFSVAVLVAVLCLFSQSHCEEAEPLSPGQLARYLSRYTSASTTFKVHVSFGGSASSRAFSYVTPAISPIPATTIEYGLSPHALTEVATGSAYFYNTGTNYTFHSVVVSSLKVDTTYYYRVGSNSTGFSDIYNFTTTTGDATYAVYGDFGLANDQSLTQLKEETAQGDITAVTHVGDFAYDLHTNNGQVGDGFLEAIEPITSHIPYMIAPGNHEESNNFSQYIHRFAGVSAGAARSSGSNTNLWYSWDHGLIHWVAIDTEAYAYYQDPVQQARQLAWLQQDLARANGNRAQVPWIVMFGHKSDWMATNFTGFGDLAQQYNVDLYLCGHVHNYLRFLPYHGKNIDTHCASADNHTYTNPKYLTKIIVGSPGCREKIAHGEGPTNKLVFHCFDYGYGHLKAFNRTHLYWAWERTGLSGDPRDSACSASSKVSAGAAAPAFLDYLWLVVDTH